jgi:5-methylcytosine-specific restriction endonuclease McrA
MARSIEQTREAKRIYMAKKRAENPEAAKEYSRNYHTKNRDKQLKVMRNYYAKRFFWSRAMKLRGENKATYKDLAKLWKSQRGLCALTGIKLNRSSQLDHIFPKAKGGKDDVSNLQWVCAEVNLAKRDLTEKEFIYLCNSVMRWIGERINQYEQRGMEKHL